MVRSGISVLLFVLFLPTLQPAPASAAAWLSRATMLHASAPHVRPPVEEVQYRRLPQPMPRLPYPGFGQPARPQAPARPPWRTGAGNGAGPGPAGVRIQPSEALRLAQRRWPRSIGLSVRLLRRGRPVYAVKLKTGNRVLLVLVDARTGRVLQ